MDKMFDRIELALKARGLTQKALASRFGWQPNRVTRMKRGEVAVTVKEACAIARELGVRVGWLVDDDAPDAMPGGGLPADELEVLRAYRRARGRLSAADVAYLIGRAVGEDAPAARHADAPGHDVSTERYPPAAAPRRKAN